MNPRLGLLHPYPFQRLARLTEGVAPPPGTELIALSIGEPQHAAPAFVTDVLASASAGLSVYPTTRASADLRQAIADWANRRYCLESRPLDPYRHVLAVSGTREALFSIAQAVVDPTGSTAPVVLMPNPFYQIYEGAALLAGAEPGFITAGTDSQAAFALEDVPDAVWDRTQLVYVCSPGNPTGRVLPPDQYIRLLELAERYDFVIASDECYSEIYFDESRPPVGLLQVAAELGSTDYRRCLVFQSLSKRSNLPGLRSGFVAGDGELLQQYYRYRTYHGCTLSPLAQAISARAWRDEEHVRTNRALYRAKFDAVLEILAPVLEVTRPDAGFYLWPRTPIDDERFTRDLLQQQNVAVLPGRYLSRSIHGHDPGAGRVRMALVATIDHCVEAARRIRRFVTAL